MNISRLKKDFLWYSIGAAVPMILGFIKTPIFTRYYSPTDYGNLALVNTTFSYINLFAFSWLLSCIWRYYIHEKNNKDLDTFYTTIAALLFIGFLFTTLAAAVWIFFAQDAVVKKLIAANYLSLVTHAITSIYLITLRLDGKSSAYNLLVSITAVISFVILLVLTFVFKNSIDAMLNCSNIVNSVFAIYIIHEFGKNYVFDLKNISRKLIRELTAYSFATILFNISLLLLVSGDRYVIKIFYSTDKVGIYNQIYGLSQISVFAFVNIFFNIVNPHLFRLYEEDITNENMFYRYVMLYLICILPCTVYFSLFSKEVAELLLGEKFRVGYKMMPYIMITTFIYGISNMHEDRLRFKHRLKKIVINLTAACMTNIVLNFIFVPVMGYEVAAVSTLIAYLLLYVLDVKADTPDIIMVARLLKSRYRLIAWMAGMLSAQVIFHYIMKYIFEDYSVRIAIIEGSVYMAAFYAFMYHKFRKDMNVKEDSLS